VRLRAASLRCPCRCPDCPEGPLSPLLSRVGALLPSPAWPWCHPGPCHPLPVSSGTREAGKQRSPSSVGVPAPGRAGRWERGGRGDALETRSCRRGPPRPLGQSGCEFSLSLSLHQGPWSSCSQTARTTSCCTASPPSPPEPTASSPRLPRSPSPSRRRPAGGGSSPSTSPSSPEGRRWTWLR